MSALISPTVRSEIDDLEDLVDIHDNANRGGFCPIQAAVGVYARVDQAEICRRYARGQSVKTIATEMGVGLRSVYDATRGMRHLRKRKRRVIP